jgi:hypothetical protein
MCNMHFKIEEAYTPIYQNTTPYVNVFLGRRHSNADGKTNSHLTTLLLYLNTAVVIYIALFV